MMRATKATDDRKKIRSGMMGTNEPKRGQWKTRWYVRSDPTSVNVSLGENLPPSASVTFWLADEDIVLIGTRRRGDDVRIGGHGTEV